MAKVTLSRLLKIKARLAREYATQVKILHRENSRISTSTSNVNRPQVYCSIRELRDKLVQIKSLIAQANSVIYPKIYEMQELKGFLAVIKSIPVLDGKRTQQPYGGSAIEEVWDAFLKQEKLDEIEKEVTDKVSYLQDEIDTYNSQTLVDIPDDLK